MNEIPPALTHPKAFTLTENQTFRLEHLPDDCVVVGADRCCPVVRTAEGRLMTVAPNGRTMQPDAHVRRRLQQRMIDYWFPVAS